MKSPLLLLFLLVASFSCPLLAHAEKFEDSNPASAAASAPAVQWVALAAGVWFKDHGGSQVGIGYARAVSKQVAIDAAIKECQKFLVNDPSHCKIVDTFNNGCEYLTHGFNPLGQSGWGVGLTPQSAYDKCHANRLNCNVPVIGGCGDSRKEMSKDQVVEAPKFVRWLSLASGTGEAPDKVQVAIASRNGLSKEEAIAAALEACNGASPYVSCKTVGTFNSGCGYITKGQGGGQVAYGAGETAQIAYDRCQATSPGIVCDTQTIGGCINE